MIKQVRIDICETPEVAFKIRERRKNNWELIESPSFSVEQVLVQEHEKEGSKDEKYFYVKEDTDTFVLVWERTN